MKILMVDKYHFIKGGAERYLFELTKILRQNGHTVLPFSMKHPDNFPSKYEKYFVDNIDYRLISSRQKWVKGFFIAGRMIYSLHAKKRLEKLIEDERPDIAHIHMIDHQISPSILHVLKKHGIPVIQTVHTYKLVCPNYRLFNMHTKQICEKCLGGNYWYPAFEKCHMDSRVASALLGLETTIHKLMGIYEKNVDLFHVPSRFMGQKIACAKIGLKKIYHLFYTIGLDSYRPNYGFDDYLIYYGRLAKEKGVLTLIKAMTKINKLPLLIVGEGPHRDELVKYSQKKCLDNITFLGKKSGEELKSLVAKSRFVVVPSEWYDNSPLVIYESFALGKPVIGSNLGGIPELITHGETGLIFEAGDPDDLSEKILYILDHPKRNKQYGMAARKKAEEVFSPEFHYEKIITRYHALLNGI